AVPGARRTGDRHVALDVAGVVEQPQLAARTADSDVAVDDGGTGGQDALDAHVAGHVCPLQAAVLTRRHVAVLVDRNANHLTQAGRVAAAAGERAGRAGVSLGGEGRASGDNPSQPKPSNGRSPAWTDGPSSALSTDSSQRGSPFDLAGTFPRTCSHVG